MSKGHRKLKIAPNIGVQPDYANIGKFDRVKSLEDTMSLTEQQRKFYENIVAVTRQEMEDLDRMIEEEWAKIKDRVEQLK